MFIEIKTDIDARKAKEEMNNFHDAVLENIYEEGNFVIFKFNSSWGFYSFLKCDKNSLEHNLEPWSRDRTVWFDAEIKIDENGKVIFKTLSVSMGQENGFIKTNQMFWETIEIDR